MATKSSKASHDPRAAVPLGLVLHVKDIAAASRFYQSLGFTQAAAYPRANGELTVAILNFGQSTILLGRQDELHYENAARARRIQRGPHGLGLVITLLVPDLERVYDAVRAADLEILLEPVDEFFGDRVFMFLDTDGYEWKISQTVAQVREQDVADIIAQLNRTSTGRRPNPARRPRPVTVAPGQIAGGGCQSVAEPRRRRDARRSAAS